MDIDIGDRGRAYGFCEENIPPIEDDLKDREGLLQFLGQCRIRVGSQEHVEHASGDHPGDIPLHGGEAVVSFLDFREQCILTAFSWYGDIAFPSERYDLVGREIDIGAR